MDGLAEWIESQQALLQLEKQEEELQLASKLASLTARECEEAGISILHLEIDNIATSLFGRTTVTVKPARQGQLLKAAGGAGNNNSYINTKQGSKLSMKVGDEVRLYNPKLMGTADEDTAVVNGVISKVINWEISIVCDEVLDENSLSAPLRLDLRSNDYTFRKMSSALADLRDSGGHPLVRALFDRGIVPGPLSNDHRVTSDNLFNKDLNASQLAAVNCALNTSSVALIHGPVSYASVVVLDEKCFSVVLTAWNWEDCHPDRVHFAGRCTEQEAAGLCTFQHSRRQSFGARGRICGT
jgi:hypothetical protein